MDRPKILVIDDSGLLLRNIKAQLDADFDVQIAVSGVLGIKAFQAAPADLVLLDYEMPGLNGVETYNFIRNLPCGAKVPIIFLTSMDSREIVIEIMKLQPQGFLLKPPNTVKLLEAIRNALRK